MTYESEQAIQVSKNNSVINIINQPEEFSEWVGAEETIVANDGYIKNSTSSKRNKQTNNLKFDSIKTPILCPICEQIFFSIIDLGLHSIFHSDNRKYSCPICKYSTISKYTFKVHVQGHEGSNSIYSCEICKKSFLTRAYAIQHKNVHTGERPFQCEICEKNFTTSYFLTSHKTRQHSEVTTGKPLVKYDCKICHSNYRSSTSLRHHMSSKHNTHETDMSMLCDICGKRLANAQKLELHKRIHSGYKPFQCSSCSKAFCRKEQLREHIRVHTGEKPYICKYCGRGFTQRSPLKIHERLHTGEKPYTCMLCDKGFISKGVMDTHMKHCKL